MGKLFDLHSYLIREAKRTNQPEPNNADLPMLWILAPTLSKPILTEYTATLAMEFSSTGVYLLSPGCKTGIIVIHQLPKIPETLWFRLLGKEHRLLSIDFTRLVGFRNPTFWKKSGFLAKRDAHSSNTHTNNLLGYEHIF
jgi:hypothetical protein